MKKGYLKWLLLCLAPIGFIVVLKVTGMGISSGLLLLLLILCPLSHLLMMRKGHSHGGEVAKVEEPESKSKEQRQLDKRLKGIKDAAL